jgi:hypothetical protein
MKRHSHVLLALLLVLGGAAGAHAQLVARGDVDLWFYGSRVRIDFEDLTNFSDAQTDRLRFRLWASEDPWRTYDRGELISIGALPRLQPNQNLSDFHRTVHVHRPDDPGWYYLTLTLEERTFDENGQKSWQIRDVVEFDGRRFFRRFSWFPFPF